MSIRKAHKSDLSSIQTLFVDTILNISQHHYSKAQLEDWASCGKDSTKWLNRLDNFTFFVYEDQSEILGFISFDNSGYIDTLFVSHVHQRKGIAQLLFDSMVTDFEQLSSHVSVAGKPFFEYNGFTVIKEQLARANKLELTNYLMERVD